MRQAFSSDGFVAHLARVALLAVTYFCVAKLSLLAAIPPGYATALWPPSGIALAALILLGPRVWPGVWLGAVLVNITVQSSFIAALLMGTGNTLEALCGAALVRYCFSDLQEFKQAADVFLFLVVAAASAIVAASLAVVPLALIHELPRRDLYWNWWTWWQGDVMGIILVTPLVLAWLAPRQQNWSWSRVAEASILTAGLFFTCHLVFSDIVAPRMTTLPLAFLVLPFIMWVAVRFRQREVTTLTAGVSAFAIAFTIQGSGPFATGSLNMSLLSLLAFMSTVAATGLVLNAVFRERARTMSSLKAVLRQLRTQATTDPLTGLYNRRFLEDYLMRELARAGRSKLTVAVIMLDLDFFKRVNDESGHAAGDAVLRELGALLRRHIRTSDVACRYGGEEFMLLLPEVAPVTARSKAEAIRLDVERCRDSLHGTTVSLGVAMFPEHGTDARMLMSAADRALYAAKQAGRNRVVVSAVDMAPPLVDGRSSIMLLNNAVEK